MPNAGLTRSCLILCSMALCHMAQTVVAQGIAINVDGAVAHGSAMLEVNVTGRDPSAGLLVPRITAAERLAIASPGNSLLVYQTDGARGFWYYDATALQWASLGSTAWGTTGNSGTDASVNAVGTSDAQPFVIRTAGQSKLQFTTIGQWVPTIAGKNVAIGDQAGQNGLASAGSVDHNVFVGTWTATQYNSGIYNTMLGTMAGQFLSSGTNNAAVGYSAMRNVSTGTRNTGAGANASTGALGSFTLGTAIGANTLVQDRGTAIGKQALATADRGTAVGFEAQAAMVTGSTNSTAIGNTAVSTGPDMVRLGNNLVSDIGGYTPWTDLSDERFKKDIAPMPDGMAFIQGLEPISYVLDRHAIRGNTSDTPSTAAIRHLGFSAQQVQDLMQRTAFPFHGLHAPSDEDDHYALAYEVLVVPLSDAVRVLHGRLEHLANERNALAEKLAELERMAETLAPAGKGRK